MKVTQDIILDGLKGKITVTLTVDDYGFPVVNMKFEGKQDFDKSWVCNSVLLRGSFITCRPSFQLTPTN